MRSLSSPARFFVSRGMLALAGLIGLVAACDRPETGTYISSGRPRGEGVLVGFNSVGDACRHFALKTEGADVTGADVYCGQWSEPAGRVRVAPADGALVQQASSIAASLAPRVTACGTPVAASVPGAEQAVQMSCTRGRYPHALLVLRSGGKVWSADGMEGVLPAMRRSIGVLAGKEKPLSEQEGTRTVAKRRPDPNDLQGLMLAGDAANREGYFEEASTYFRRAVALQDSARRRDGTTFSALMGLGIQLSNQRKFSEADAVFARAGEPDLQFSSVLSPADYDHYRGLDRLNRGVVRGTASDIDAAIELLISAEKRYAAILPTQGAVGGSSLATRFSPTPIVAQISTGSGAFAADPSALEAVLGVIETRRNQSIAYRAKGDFAQAITAAEKAETFARANGMTVPKVAAFFYRTSGVSLLSGGQVKPSIDKLGLSVDAFHAGWRDIPTPQLAQAQLRRAEALLRDGNAEATFRSCRDAAQLLSTLRQGVAPDLLTPCLTAYARQAGQASDPQPVLIEMFQLAQLARASSTADLTQRAALRLAADPKIASELSARDAAGVALNDLRERRAALSGPGAAEQISAIDKQIKVTEEALRQSEVDLQQAMPNYHTLLDQAVPADVLFRTLRPGEAFASISLSEDDGWTFLLRDGKLRLGHVAGGNKAVGELVDKIRESLKPSGDSLPKFDVDSARKLYAATLGDVAAGLEGASELTVAPSGRLLSIPFELLVTDTGSAAASASTPYLVSKFAITHVLSGANLLRMREASAKAVSAKAQRWFGFGDARKMTQAEAMRLYPFDRCGESRSASDILQLPPLPGAEKELTAAGRLYHATPADALRNVGFTRNAVLSRSYENYSVLHFAAHALLSNEVACQDEPAIVTTLTGTEQDTSLLTATDIFANMGKLKLNADVVVLSACNTGGGSGKAGGEGLSGLARSFFFAGARALMVTHWPVDDETNVHLVLETLNSMRDSASGALAPALRKAQLKLMATAGYEHPFFWAPMAVIGEGGGHAALKVAAAAGRNSGS